MAHYSSLREPNNSIRRARLRIPSQRGFGMRMSRQELAEAVNEWIFLELGRQTFMDAGYVGKLLLTASPEHRRPTVPLGAGLGVVLKTARLSNDL